MDCHSFSATQERKTKIVATVGPATLSAERLRELILAGVDVFRLNFSHGDHQQHTNSLNIIRAISRELGRPVAILQDLCGPKMRIAALPDDGIFIEDGSKVILAPKRGEQKDADWIVVEDLNPAKIVRVNERVLLADGLIELAVDAIENERVLCSAVKGGALYSRQGIAFPDSRLDLPATTAKDLEDLKWGLEHKVDYVALSFVASASDITTLKKAAALAPSPPRIMAKIERREALENIEEIIAVSDAIMVARGDLGINLPLEQVPLIQKRIIALANTNGIPVVVATQMLRSMMTSIRPTRAEVSDIAVAVLSGADAIMLSEETAIGENPIECIRVMDKVARTCETEFDNEQHRFGLYKSDQKVVSDSVAFAACTAASQIDAAAVIACTETGTSARLVAKYRPKQPLFGASSHSATLQQMALYWGVKPLAIPSLTSPTELIETSLKLLCDKQPEMKGKQAVITSGLTQTPGGTSKMQIRTI